MKVLLLGDFLTNNIPQEVMDIKEYFQMKSSAHTEEVEYYRFGIENFTSKMMKEFGYRNINVDPFDMIILQCGSNDFLYSKYSEDYKTKTPAEISDSIIDFAEEIKRTCKAKLVVQSLYPVVDGGYRSLNLLGRDIQEVNTNLKAYCNHNDVEFLDVFSRLATPNGNARIDLYSDCIHPNREGYEVIRDIIEGVVVKYLESQNQM